MNSENLRVVAAPDIMSAYASLLGNGPIEFLNGAIGLHVESEIFWTHEKILNLHNIPVITASKVPKCCRLRVSAVWWT